MVQTTTMVGFDVLPLSELSRIQHRQHARMAGTIDSKAHHLHKDMSRCF